jgi:hypothetical protein
VSPGQRQTPWSVAGLSSLDDPGDEKLDQALGGKAEQDEAEQDEA